MTTQTIPRGPDGDIAPWYQDQLDDEHRERQAMKKDLQDMVTNLILALDTLDKALARLESPS